MSVELKNTTVLAENILTSDHGRVTYNSVSPIYGNGRIALEIMNAQGDQLDDLEKTLSEFAAQLDPRTATWGLFYWEQEYDIPVDESLDIEERRQAVLLKMNRRVPSTPESIKTLIETLTGAKVTINENTDKNTFEIIVQPDETENISIGLIKEAVDRQKPAQLAYNTCITNVNDLRLLKSEKILEIKYPMCGTMPYPAQIGSADRQRLHLKNQAGSGQIILTKSKAITGTKPYPSEIGRTDKMSLNLRKVDGGRISKSLAPETKVGTSPYTSQAGRIDNTAAKVAVIETFAVRKTVVSTSNEQMPGTVKGKNAVVLDTVKLNNQKSTASGSKSNIKPSSSTRPKK